MFTIHKFTIDYKALTSDYRVRQLCVYLGWVDMDLKNSAVCLILLGIGKIVEN